MDACPSRAQATLTAARGRLWLLGGADRAGNADADLWEYVPDGYVGELHSEKAPNVAAGWRRHQAEEGGFTGRLGHAAATWSDSILVFGGQARK